MRRKKQKEISMTSGKSTAPPQELLSLISADDDSENEDNELAQYAHLLKDYKLKEFKDDIASDLDESEDDSEDDATTGDWGSRRKIFYGTEGEDELMSGVPGARAEQVEAEDEAVEVEQAEVDKLRRRMYGTAAKQQSVLSMVQEDESQQDGEEAGDQREMLSDEEEDDDDVVAAVAGTMVGGVKPYRPPAKGIDLNKHLKNYPDLEHVLKKLEETKKSKSKWWGEEDSRLSQQLLFDKWYSVMLVAYIGMREERANLHNHPITVILQKLEKKFEDIHAKPEENKKRIRATDNGKRVSKKAKLLKDDLHLGADLSEDEAALKMLAGVEDDEDTHRPPTYEILKNKEAGAAHARARKRDRNPRVKHRHKFKKALKRRKSQVPQQRQQNRPYTGETAGIRSGIIKSRKLRV